MRAKDAVQLGTVDYTLAYPQDGKDQPATYIEVAANRSVATTLTALVRPINGRPNSSVATLKFVQPVVRTVDGVETTIDVNRATIEVRLSDKSNSTEISAIKTALSAALASGDINVIFSGERLV